MLGLSPRCDVGPRHFDLDLHVGTVVPSAQGSVPGGIVGGAVKVSWVRVSGGVQITLTMSSPIMVKGWPTGPVGQYVTLASTAQAVVKGFTH
jgi:hypothetical protein